MDIALEFAAAAASCTSDRELKHAVDGITNELGFEHFAVVHHLSYSAADPQLVTIDNYPEAWAEEFVGGRLFLDDPVLQASTRTAKGFRWADVAGVLPIRAEHLAVLERSLRYGMGQGFTVPVNVPGEPHGSCSFSVKAGRSIGEKTIRMAELIGIDAFDAARRIHRHRDQCRIPHLSRRQRQCVALAATGASDKAIARLLHLSPETVRLYMKAARAAYDAASRTDLVVRALRDGAITFLDASPAKRRG